MEREDFGPFERIKVPCEVNNESNSFHFEASWVTFMEPRVLVVMILASLSFLANFLTLTTHKNKVLLAILQELENLVRKIFLTRNNPFYSLQRKIPEHFTPSSTLHYFFFVI